MNFTEMTKKLFAGMPVRRVDWKVDYHLELGQGGAVVDEDDFPYTFNKYDYTADWEVYAPAMKDDLAGMLLSYITLDGDKNLCVLVEDSDDNSYTVVDMSDWSVYAKHIRKGDLDIFLEAYNLTKEKKTEDK